MFIRAPLVNREPLTRRDLERIAIYGKLPVLRDAPVAVSSSWLERELAPIRSCETETSTCSQTTSLRLQSIQ